MERAEHRLPQRPVWMRQGCRLTGLQSSVRVLHARSWFGFELSRHSAFIHTPREQESDFLRSFRKLHLRLQSPTCSVRG